MLNTPWAAQCVCVESWLMCVNSGQEHLRWHNANLTLCHDFGFFFAWLLIAEAGILPYPQKLLLTSTTAARKAARKTAQEIAAAQRATAHTPGSPNIIIICAAP